MGLELVFWSACGAIGSAMIANAKHREGLLWGFLGLFLGPLAILIVGFMPALDPKVLAGGGPGPEYVGRVIKWHDGAEYRIEGFDRNRRVKLIRISDGV